MWWYERGDETNAGFLKLVKEMLGSPRRPASHSRLSFLIAGAGALVVLLLAGARNSSLIIGEKVIDFLVGGKGGRELAGTSSIGMALSREGAEVIWTGSFSSPACQWMASTSLRISCQNK